jgi:hypothetical protein
MEFLWRWYVTIPTGGLWEAAQTDALLAIASVAAIVWTGGLIAFQIKAPSTVNNLALDLLQTSFVGSAFALFLHGETLRAAATVFLVYYVAITVWGLYCSFRTSLIRRFWKAIPNRDSLSDEVLLAIGRAAAVYYRWTLLSMTAFVAVIIFPHQTAVAWIAGLLLYVGLQLALRSLYFGRDKDNPMSAIATYAGFVGGNVSLQAFLQQVQEWQAQMQREQPGQAPVPSPQGTSRAHHPTARKAPRRRRRS